MHISSALKIKPYGEEYQYLTGEIGQSMFKIAKRFLCDDCRQKLVIEIKEIDKKRLIFTRYAAEMWHFLFIYNKLDKNLFIY